jgi:hypothetical protein
MNPSFALEGHMELLEQRVMKVSHVGYDAAARQLCLLSDKHAVQGREEMVLRAGQAAVDLRGLSLPLWR